MGEGKLSKKKKNRFVYLFEREQERVGERGKWREKASQADSAEHGAQYEV